ncbi:MAG: GTP-binding protein [Methylococcales bacterium]
MKSARLIEQIPVIIISGFLGRGKTTQLNQLLTDITGSGLNLLFNRLIRSPIALAIGDS